MIGFIDAYFTISHNYSQLQQLTVNLQPKPSLTAEESLHSHSRSRLTSDLRLDYLYSLETAPNKAHPRLFTAPLPSNRCLVVPGVCFCGNVFSGPLTSNEHGADHIENTSSNTFSNVACSYFGFPRNGSTCQPVKGPVQRLHQQSTGSLQEVPSRKRALSCDSESNSQTQLGVSC
jgi:hypothetical protein